MIGKFPTSLCQTIYMWKLRHITCYTSFDLILSFDELYIFLSVSQIFCNLGVTYWSFFFNNNFWHKWLKKVFFRMAWKSSKFAQFTSVKQKAMLHWKHWHSFLYEFSIHQISGFHTASMSYIPWKITLTLTTVTCYQFD